MPTREGTKKMKKRINPKVIEHLARKNSEINLHAALRMKQIMRELAELGHSKKITGAHARRG